MSSHTSYPKRGNTQPLNWRRSSVSDSGLARPAHNRELTRADKRGVDQADLLMGHMAYLTTSEAASYLRVSKQFLEIARHRGDGPPYIKLTRAVRYYRPSLDQWMLKRQRNHTVKGEV